MSDVMNPSPELADVYERVEKGVAWITEHDPTGAFHFWFKSGITPRSPMPAHAGEDDDTRERYEAYYDARVLFEKLWQRMERLERKEARAS